MAEKEFIEREKLKQAFSTDTQSIRGWDVDLFDLLMIEIDEAPAADVVEVVRCKECKHLFQDLSEREAHLCMRHRFERVRVNLDDFCSYGERKDG